MDSTDGTKAENAVLMKGWSVFSAAAKTLLPGLFKRPDPIVDRESLQRFMDSRAAFMSQKGIVEFCRVRAGIYWQKLFAEEDFRQVLSHSCWQAYAPALALVSQMVEAALREAAGVARPRMAQAVEAVAHAAYLSYPTPAGFTAEEWADRFGLVRARMAEIVGEPARPVRKMPEGMAELIFTALPIHPSIVKNDSDYIFNNVRMNLLRAHDDFLAAADLPRLVESLLDDR